MQQSKIQTICIVGLGYAGLPTAATFAARGFDVVGVDINRDAVERINSGRAHIVEPDLDMVLAAAVKSGKLRAVTAPQTADVFVVAVPTPITQDHKADISAVEAARQRLFDRRCPSAKDRCAPHRPGVGAPPTKPEVARAPARSGQRQCCHCRA
jgi:UDP-N-acetyl-D-mannosaminuronic acid dehydrogenase